VVALLAAGVASAGDRGQQRPPPQERTYPRMIPPRGHPGTSFAAYFTMRHRPGHEGFVAMTYRVTVAGAARLPARCLPPRPETVQSGEPGSIARVPLPAPLAGWCRARYRVTVFLDRDRYCPRPGPGEPPQPCPLFPDLALNTGAAHFVVR
jgi:hypothetical protein